MNNLRQTKNRTLLTNKIKILSGKMFLGLLLLVSGCHSFPSLQVSFNPPNDSELSKIVEDNWMSVDRGIITAVRQLVQARIGSGSTIATRHDLELVGFSCELAPSKQCSHTSVVNTISFGPSPANGKRERRFTVMISADAESSIDSIKALKKQD
jgi:hypothetical protein